MANPFPFTAGQVLTAAQMNGIGETDTYTPTWTNVTVGNGTQTFSFTRVQDLVLVRGTLVFGSTTSISSNPNITLPVTARTQTAGFALNGITKFLDTGTAAYYGFVTELTTTTAGIRIFTTSGTLLAAGAISSTAPFTWTTNDEINLQFVYQAA
jgi:hypothetical protein